MVFLTGSVAISGFLVLVTWVDPLIDDYSSNNNVMATAISFTGTHPTVVKEEEEDDSRAVVPLVCIEHHQVQSWRIVHHAATAHGVLSVLNASLYCGVGTPKMNSSVLPEQEEQPQRQRRRTFHRYWQETKPVAPNHYHDQAPEFLPRDDDIQALYGSKPVILQQHWGGGGARRPTMAGMETGWLGSWSSNHNDNDNNDPPFLVPHIVGLYNSGTNALAQLLYANFPQLTKTTGSGSCQHSTNHTTSTMDIDSYKHYPKSLQPFFHNQQQTNVLRLVLVRDPYRWMQSTCRSPYDLIWVSHHDDEPPIQQTKTTKDQPPPVVVPPPHYNRKCLDRYPPHSQAGVSWTLASPPPSSDITKNHEEGATTTTSTSIPSSSTLTMQYPSLPQLWSGWNGDYMAHNAMTASSSSQTDMPTLVIRFEDLLFHADTVLTAIANCTGLQRTETLVYPWNRSKTHGTNTYRLETIRRQQRHHGNDTLRPPNASTAKASTQWPLGGFVHVLMQTGRKAGRLTGLSAGFFNYTIQQHGLDATLLHQLHYSIPTWEDWKQDNPSFDPN